MQNQDELNRLAAKVDQLEGIIAGLTAYIALTSRPYPADQKGLGAMLKEVSPDPAHGVQSAIHRSVGGQIAVPGRGSFAAIGFAAVETAREKAIELGLMPKD